MQLFCKSSHACRAHRVVTPNGSSLLTSDLSVWQGCCVCKSAPTCTFGRRVHKTEFCARRARPVAAADGHAALRRAVAQAAAGPSSGGDAARESLGARLARRLQARRARTATGALCLSGCTLEGVPCECPAGACSLLRRQGVARFQAAMALRVVLCLSPRRRAGARGRGVAGGCDAAADAGARRRDGRTSRCVRAAVRSWLGVLAARLRLASLHCQSQPASRSCQTVPGAHYHGSLRVCCHRGGSVL